MDLSYPAAAALVSAQNTVNTLSYAPPEPKPCDSACAAFWDDDLHVSRRAARSESCQRGVLTLHHCIVCRTALDYRTKATWRGRLNASARMPSSSACSTFLAPLSCRGGDPHASRGTTRGGRLPSSNQHTLNGETDADKFDATVRWRPALHA